MRLTSFKQILILLGALTSLVLLSAETTVTATGRAEASLRNAKEIALTRALREAVRKGAGVDLLSVSKVSDFQLVYDEIFASAFGYVRDYTITKWEVDDALMYITIEAVVGSKQPDDNQALRMIVQRKGSPRVLVSCASEITGTGEQVDVTGLLSELALQYQLQLIDARSVERADGQRRVRDDLAGDSDRQKWRAANSTYDFEIRGALVGKSKGEKQLYGAAVEEFSLGADLSAIWPATGQLVAQVTVPSTTVTSSSGLRDASLRLLKGAIPATRASNAETLLRRIVIRWMAELDSGTMLRLEFFQVTRAELDQLKDALRQTTGIEAVNERDFDAKGLAVLEVQSILDGPALSDIVGKELPDWLLDRSETTALQFSRGVPSDTGTDGGKRSASTSLPGWLWALVGMAVVLVGLGLFQLGKRSGKA